ncbi:unnamed protein product [Chironomus riparius]|uniref:Polypeptide N-acetylgalactosaminyltransferase n=1 Tax=Chironomus riparius TaxID=315576 RepID=A0A9N9WMI4_9DIPT|nr:unnamed protein product [Chironomus riparius]
MKVYARKGRLIRIVLILCIIPLLYLLINYSESRKNLHKIYNGRLASKLIKEEDVHLLSEGLGNYEPKNDEHFNGPGEGGLAFNTEAVNSDDSEIEYGMNMFASDQISLNRTIKDTRPKECKRWMYPQNLPTVSVIIVFHNEGFSVLMRTVHSVLNRSPPQFLKEILLVDDYSDKTDLKEKLDKYVERFDGRVRVIRNEEREGLIRTRSRGAQEATAEVIVFLDAHCEVNKNWLVPLLTPIAFDEKTMTVPIIDGIDHKTFEYRPVYGEGHNFRGIFEWGLLYKENELPKREEKRRAHSSEPYYSPTHAGGLFAINRKYFLELGAYDAGLLVWGGENFELSFKIWQCGGKIMWVPCSRVGHVYRGFMPYNFGKLAEKKKGPLITINYKRVVEVWMDDQHKEYFYTREPSARYLEMGDISDQLALKERLGCKSFSWFMENVAYDVYDKYPQLPENIFWGELINSANMKCFDAMGRQPPSLVGLQHCHGYGNNQLVRLNAAGQLGIGERCVDADSTGIKLVYCRLGTVDGPWVYKTESKSIFHRTQNKCIAVHPVSSSLSLMPCDPNNSFQQWMFKIVKPR